MSEYPMFMLGLHGKQTINQQKLWWNRLLFSWLFHQSPFLFSFHLPGCSEALVQKWGLDLGSLQVKALTLAFLSVPFSHFNFDATVLQHLECQQLEKYRAVHDATHGFSRPSFSFGSFFGGFVILKQKPMASFCWLYPDPSHPSLSHIFRNIWRVKVELSPEEEAHLGGLNDTEHLGRPTRNVPWKERRNLLSSILPSI